MVKPLTILKSHTMMIESYIEQRQQRIQHLLSKNLPTPSQAPERLHQAMHYVMHNGGKRIRPLLVYAAGEAFSAPLSQLDTPAIAIECVHTYSLIHDDLPAMDNDDYRRGQPSCHRYFDEAIAILAGDTLQSLAFELLSQNSAELPMAKQLQMIQQLASAIGSHGMAGGQALDLQFAGNDIEAEQLLAIHQRKTGALIKASIMLGALASPDWDPCHTPSLTQLGHNLGLAFQIQDDLFDYAQKPCATELNYVQVMGFEAAQTKLKELTNNALKAICDLDSRAKPLRELTMFILQRDT